MLHVVQCCVGMIGGDASVTAVASIIVLVSESGRGMPGSVLIATTIVEARVSSLIDR